MKFTLTAALPAIVMTLVSIYTHRTYPNGVLNDAISLGMFAAWSLSGLSVALYRGARIVRLTSGKHQS